MSKFKLTQTAAEVQDILNNSLQKPTGLAKTKLVGVGVNGQENIEIGDNLTLANGKLSAAAGGGGDGKLYCHFIEIDTKNREQICFNYTSTDETKLTKETIFSALKDKKLICTGYIMVRDAAKRLQYIYVANDGFNDLLRVK